MPLDMGDFYPTHRGLPPLPTPGMHFDIATILEDHTDGYDVMSAQAKREAERKR